MKVIKTNITTKRITGAKNTTHNCKDRRKKPTKGKRLNVMQNQRNKQTNKKLLAQIIVHSKRLRNGNHKVDNRKRATPRGPYKRAIQEQLLGHTIQTQQQELVHRAGA